MDNHKRRPWHSQSAEQVLKEMKTTQEGLSDAEAEKRLQKYGKNTLRQKPPKSILKMFFEQITDVMVLILIGAAVLSACLNEWVEAIVIMSIVIIDAIIGVVQEKKAADALEALRSMSAPHARVMRNEEESIVPAEELVPGDIVYLEDGCIVPADMRLIESSNLKIQEASLTGESVPAEKDSDEILSEDSSIGDRINMAYTSSIVMYGTGVGVVVATGMNTQVGEIAGALDNQDETDTPIKRKLNYVGKVLSIIGLIVCALIFGIGLLYGRSIIPLLMTAISLSISIIPEGLPATATIVMALGVQRMAKRQALVRKLPAVETLGSASVICCDKTGTLTQNRMTVTKILLPKNLNNFEAEDINQIEEKEAYQLLLGAMLCNNASLDPDNPGEILGDPTEGALIFLAKNFGMEQEEFEDKYVRVFEQPFDSDRKRMTTVNKINGRFEAYTKGAVDEMLPLCTHIMTSQGIMLMTESARAGLQKACINMSEQALRVLGFAKRTMESVPEDDDEDIEHNLIFIGAVGMIDPPRKEVISAIKTCRKAGIRTVMITGDHKITAMAIAKQLGIFQDGNMVVSGDELHAMSDKELDSKVKDITVFARVSPHDKLRIIESLKRTGEVAAMTGDGVNDAPALKSADIGVAMGKNGTDVAKDSADVILLNDNFTTIEHAIKEGRRVYRNIQKVIQFLLSGNVAEILALFIATLFNWDPPLLAVHILLINLATDSLPAIALGVDPADKRVMLDPPVHSNSLFDKGLINRVILNGALLCASTVAVYWIGLSIGNYASAVTMAFVVLAVSQLFLSFNQRSNTESIFAKSEPNRTLYFAVLASAIVLIVVLFVPPVRNFLSLSPLTGVQWLVSIGFSFAPLVIIEIIKAFIRRKKNIKSVAAKI